MRIGVLALQGDVAEHERALAALGVSPRPVRTPGDLGALDGIVLPGGESTAISHLAATSGLADGLAGAFASGLPAFGTCAGLIMLAVAIEDGRADQRCYGVLDVTVRRNALGRQVHSAEREITLAGIAGPPLRAVFIRAPVIVAVGAGVEVLGSAGDDPVAVRGPHALGTTFHPELTGDLRLHELFLAMVKEA